MGSDSAQEEGERDPGIRDDFEAMRSEGDLNLGPEREQWLGDAVDEETRDLLEEDARYFFRQSLSTPCLDALALAQGPGFTDLAGRRFLDFHGNGLHQVGYGHPRVLEAIRRQLETLPFCPRRFTNRPAVALARRLAELAPGRLSKVLFAPGGTTAIGMALKIARAATGRFKTLSLWESFHGASLDAISIGGEALFRRGAGPLLPGTEHAPPPDPWQGPWPDMAPEDYALRTAEYIDYVLEREGGDIGAVIAETVRWTPFVPPRAYWDRIRSACDRHGALLILDEIPTCLGRSGRMFVCEHYELEPDILVLGKGLGGGVFPLAAVVARPELDAAPEGALGHYTHEKNPVACAAALATLDVIEEEGLAPRAAALGERALVRMRAMQERHALVADVRGLGLLLGLVLRRPDGAPAVLEAERLLYRCLRRGLSFKLTMGSIVTLAPPLIISEEDLERAFDVIEEELAELERAGS